MNGVIEGYKFYMENSLTYIGSFEGDIYIKSISKEIDALTEDINKSFKNFKTNSAQLKGDIAEKWHSGTHNIDAARRGLKGRTTVERSHDFASPDIISDSGEKFGLKYMAGGKLSAKAQAVSYFERYNEYKVKYDSDISFREYLKSRNISSDDFLLNEPIYKGQIRIIPKDQMNEAIRWLKWKIEKEESTRPEQIVRYKETLSLLSDRVKTVDGAESIPLSVEDAKKLANLAKNSEFDPTKYGLTTEEFVKFKYIIQQSVQAGLTSAMISLVLKVGPQVYKAIEYLIRTGDIDEKQLRDLGFSSISGFAEGFLRGTVSAAITSSCKSGLIGQSLKTVDPSVIGAVTVIFMNVMKNSYEVAFSRKSKHEMINELIKDMYVSTCSLIAGGFTQSMIEIPILGYMLGSLVGSMIGGISYELGYSKLLSFCVESGFTLFGLVEQDYTVPSELLEQLGFDIFELDPFNLEPIEPERFELDPFELEQFNLDPFVNDNVELVYVRRGVIGINRIGYINA